MPTTLAAADGLDAKRTKIDETAGKALSFDKLRAVKLREGAVLPVRGSEFAAGYDLSACEGTSIPAGGRGIVKTGLTIAIPWGTSTRVVDA